MNETLNVTTDQTIVSQGISYIESIMYQLLNKIVVALIILLIGFIIGQLISKVAYRVLNTLEIDKKFRMISVRISLEHFLSGVTEYVTYFISIVLALNQIGLTTAVINSIAIIGIILIIISSVLTLTDIVPNIFGFILIHHKGLFQAGNTISIESIEGKVIKVSLTDTKVEKSNGDLIYIPNAKIIKSQITVIQTEKSGIKPF